MSRVLRPIAPVLAAVVLCAVAVLCATVGSASSVSASASSVSASASVPTSAVPISAAPTSAATADRSVPRGDARVTGRWRAVRLDVSVSRIGDVDVAWADVSTSTVPRSASRPLLLLNGTASPMAEWDPALLAALERSGRRVVVFDYPGLGASGSLRRPVSFDAYADVVAGLATVLSPDRIDVLGWSMGGFVAQRLLVRHPEVVGRVVLAGTNPGGRRAVLGPPWVQRVDSDPDAGLRAYVRTNYPRGARADGWAFVRRIETMQASGAYPPSRVPRRTYDAMVEAEDPWLRSDANADGLRGVSSPVLVMTGVQDVVTPPLNSRRLARLVPGARLRLWPGAGHSFVFQSPDQVARRVSDFLG